MLDDIIPVRENYRPPSPLPERAPSLSNSPKKPRSKSRTGEHVSDGRSVSGARGVSKVKKEEGLHIDITYSADSQMIHRFINFEIAPDNQEKVFVSLQKYI